MPSAARERLTSNVVAIIVAAALVLGVSASASARTFRLTVTAAGAGEGLLLVSTDGVGHELPFTARYESGSVVTLQAAATADSVFVGWSGACRGLDDCVVSMNASRTVVARFARSWLDVAIVGSGSGTVVDVSPGSGIIECRFSCRGGYRPDAAVELRAVAADDSTFQGWEGACRGAGACVLTMQASRRVTARFTRRFVSVIKRGTGNGRIVSTPAGIDCDPRCSVGFRPGTAVQLVAVPDETSVFVGWESICRGRAPCSLVLAGDRSVVARFASSPLTVSTTGSGVGTVSSSAGDIECPRRCVAGQVPGTTVELIAVADPGSVFAGWSGACSGVHSCRVTMSTARTVTARFLLSSGRETVTLARAAFSGGFWRRQEAQLVASAGGVLWSETSESAIRMVPASGGMPLTVVPRRDTPASLAADDERLVWIGVRSPTTSPCQPIDDHALAAVRLDGGPAMMLDQQLGCATLPLPPFAFFASLETVLADDAVYWFTLEASEGGIEYAIRRQTFTGASTVVASGPRALGALARDAGYLYWHEATPDGLGVIKRMPLHGRTVTTVATGMGGISNLVVSQGRLIMGGEGGDILTAPATGGDTTILASTGSPIRRIAVSAGTVYWIDDSSLHTVPLAGGRIRTRELGEPSGLVATGQDVVVAFRTCCVADPFFGETTFYRIVEVDAATHNVRVLADMNPLSGPPVLASNSNDVFWADSEGTIVRARVAPVEGDVMADIPGRLPQGVASQLVVPLAVAAGRLYFADMGTIKSVSPDGGDVDILAQHFTFGRIGALATDGARVFWLEVGSRSRAIVSVEVGGGPVTVVSLSPSTGEEFAAIALDASHVYWLAESGTSRALLRTRRRGGEVDTTLVQAFISDFVLDGREIFFVTRDTIARIASSGGNITVVTSLPSSLMPRRLAVDATHVYWIDADSVGRVPKHGGSPEVLAAGLQSDPLTTNAIAVDRRWVYWTETGAGLIKRRAR